MVNMELDMVADMEVDKVANMVADNNNFEKINIDIDINMEIQFGERVGHRAGLVNLAQNFRSEAYPNCASIVSLLKRTFI